MKVIIFDIETGPVDQNELIRMMPEFEAPSNYSKPDTIKSYLIKKKEEYLNGDGAALSALTGEVLAIGYCEYDTETKERSETKIIEGVESEILKEFWDIISDKNAIVGFNSNYFDIPFLMRRSWKNNVNTPTILQNGKYIDIKFVDLINIWSCGAPQKIKLDTLAKFLNVGGKNGDGALFSEIYKF